MNGIAAGACVCLNDRAKVNPMMTDQETTYDEIPYGDNYFPSTHPAHLATMGLLFGIATPELSHCRVLELGCASGGNLLPMALELPDAHFVGIDLSQRQVSEGLKAVDRLGLHNLDLLAMSITDVDDSFGQFDYILCHGVFSWVPEPVRTKILDICARNLAANGIAYVSYNTYPGWHARGMVREMLAFHVRNASRAQDQVQASRAFLEQLVQVVPDQASSFARILRTENEFLRRVPDSYLFHEHLEAINQPLYFHQFSKLATDKGLKFLVEARSGGMVENLPAESREALEEWSNDELGREQYLDYLCNRTFRQSLLIHDTQSRLAAPTADAIDSLWISTGLTPVSAAPELSSSHPEEFQKAEGDARVTTNDPLVKTALVTLAELAPRSIRFDSLWERVSSRLELEMSVDDPEAANHLKQALLRCFMSSLVQLRIVPPRFASDVAERPVASPLARLQAEDGDRVVNLRGFTVRLDSFERLVIRALDGTHNRTELLNHLIHLVDSGEFSIHSGDQEIEDRATIEAILSDALTPCLERLMSRALFTH